MAIGIAALLLSFGTASAQDSPAGLRVLTYNVLHDGAWSGFFDGGTHLEERLSLTIGELQRLQPDIIALQEASVSRRHGNVPQRIAETLGYQLVYAPATELVSGFRPLDWLIVTLLGFREGPAILSRFPVTASEVYELPRCRHRLEPRVLLRAEIATPEGPLHIFSTHTARGDECQIRRVGELFQAHRETGRAVLMGDFNTGDQSETVTEWLTQRSFIDVFRSANPAEPGFTVWQHIHEAPSTATRRVDFIFLVDAEGGAEASVRESRLAFEQLGRLPDGTPLWPSDHRGVFAEFAPRFTHNHAGNAGRSDSLP